MLHLKLKCREDSIGVFSEYFGIVPVPRLLQVRRRRKFRAIFSQKIWKNDQNLGCLFKIIYFWHRSRTHSIITSALSKNTGTCFLFMVTVTKKFCGDGDNFSTVKMTVREFFIFSSRHTAGIWKSVHTGMHM